nr:regulator of microtubule dynamics protein 1-like isoform X1 [Leptinotarsa decemlineata]
MSKLKVSLSHLVRPLFARHKLKKANLLSSLYLLSFVKTLRYYTPFADKHDEEKISKLWCHHTVPEILSLADRLHEEERYMDAYELLDRIRLVKEPEVLWRIARVLYNLSFEHEVTSDVRWEMLEEAQDVLDIALSLGIESAEVHKWSAIILDTYNGLINLENRVKSFTSVRDHLKRACELDPRDFTAHYMLGKWFFQMCQLNWFQRMIAKYFIATEPPKSSYDQAYKKFHYFTFKSATPLPPSKCRYGCDRYLLKAEELQPRTFLPNMYLLGETCVETGQFYKAKYYLNLAISLPPRDDCERCCVSKVRYLLRKLERFDMGKSVLFYDPLGFND